MNKSKQYIKDNEKHLEFTVNKTIFKETAWKRDNKGNFDLVRIKNVEKGTYKWLKRSDIDKIKSV